MKKQTVMSIYQRIPIASTRTYYQLKEILA